MCIGTIAVLWKVFEVNWYYAHQNYFIPYLSCIYHPLPIRILFINHIIDLIGTSVILLAYVLFKGTNNIGTFNKKVFYTLETNMYPQMFFVVSFFWGYNIMILDTSFLCCLHYLKILKKNLSRFYHATELVIYRTSVS